MSSFFVTGTDTNVGKTLLSSLLVAALDAVYWKPIQTGTAEGADRERVIEWTGIRPEKTIPEVYRFEPPVSPHLAAEAAGVRIDFGRIALPQPMPGSLIVEGAGGILVPINETETMLDLARKLSLPVVIASRTALGTINHTSLTVRVLRCAGIPVKGVVMIGHPNLDNERSIERYAAVPVIGRIPWLAEINRRTLVEVFRSGFDPKAFV